MFNPIWSKVKLLQFLNVNFGDFWRDSHTKPPFGVTTRREKVAMKLAQESQYQSKVVILTNQTMHYHKGNPPKRSKTTIHLHCLILPKLNVEFNDPCQSTSQILLQLGHSHFALAEQNLNFTHPELQRCHVLPGKNGRGQGTSTDALELQR